MAADSVNEEVVPQASSRAELHHDGRLWRLEPRLDDQPVRAPAGIVPALENGIAIIVYLNQKAPRAAPLSEISASLSISKSHCHSLLKTLCHFEWLHFDPDTKMYSLQSGILSDISSVLNAPMISVIRPELTALVERVGVPCLLSKPLDDDSFVVIERYNAQHIMEVSFPTGHRFPRNACAQMRAYLAWQQPGRLETWMQQWAPVRYTSKTLLDPDSIRAEVQATRRRGYSRSVGEFTDGLMALGLPIFDRAGQVAYVFNCSSLIGLLEPREAEVALEMQKAAARIHRALAAAVPPDFPSG